MLQRAKLFLGVVLVLICAPVGMASAQYISPNYQVNETFFGSGGELQDISPSYQAKVAAGELGVDHITNPINFIQGNSATSGGSSVNSQTCAYTSNVTAGNLLVVAAGWANTNTAGTISDTQGNTWSTATAYNGGSLPNYSSAIYYAVANTTGADTVTVTPGGAPASFVRAFVHEYSGANALDVAAANQSGSSGTTATSGSMATSHSNELIFAWPLFDAGSPSPGTGYTTRESNGGEITEDQSVNSKGTYTATASTTASTNWSIVAATFYNAGAGYQAYSGFNTTDRPVLEVAVTGGTFDLGTLTTAQARAISTAFTVRSYLSSGYVVQVGGTSPKNGSYALNNLTSPTASSPGTEQFGINLAANNLTGIGAFGAAPAQVPDTTFGFGVANSDYATTNLFKYIENDPIAHSNSSSGITQYTMSAIANITSTTPGGSYGTSLFVNAVPTF